MQNVYKNKLFIHINRNFYKIHWNIQMIEKLNMLPKKPPKISTRLPNNNFKIFQSRKRIFHQLWFCSNFFSKLNYSPELIAMKHSTRPPWMDTQTPAWRRWTHCCCCCSYDCLWAIMPWHMARAMADCGTLLARENVGEGRKRKFGLVNCICIFQ